MDDLLPVIYFLDHENTKTIKHENLIFISCFSYFMIS